MIRLPCARAVALGARAGPRWSAPSGAADADHRATAVRRRRRLVREPVEPAKSARGDPRAYVAPGRKTEARVTLTDEKLWDYPFLHVTGHGNISSATQKCCGFANICSAAAFSTWTTTTDSTASFRREISASFPDRQLVDVPLTHPIYHIVYDFPQGIPKIHEHDGQPARGFGIFLGDRSPCTTATRAIWERLGGYRGLSRSAGAARSGTPDGREPLHLRRHESPAP